MFKKKTDKLKTKLEKEKRKSKQQIFIRLCSIKV